tara:strand:- start:8516 stop:9163 length:648 start_codon:yes stop_codon:yes gene_type:complete
MEKNKRRFLFSVYVQDLVAIPLAKLFIRLSCKANYVTLLGLFLAIFSGIAYLNQSYILGSIFFFGALILDSTDGRVARATNTFSKFGATLDAIADKVRSFFVAFCFLWSLDLSLASTFLFFGFYILLPIIRFLMSLKDSNFYDPTILFWDATPLKDWFVDRGVLGLYTGWERSVVALSIAPLTVYKIEIFCVAIILEQLLFILGFCFFKNHKIGI